MTWRHKLMLVAGVAVLAIGVGISVSPKKVTIFYRPPQGLKAMLPGSGAEWTAEDRPLGETETSVGEVEKILQFSDAIYRVYRHGNQVIGVYIAYWEPGKMDPWLVTLHTPDVCWMGNGGRIVWKDNAFALAPTAEGRLHAGRARRFEWPGVPAQEVVYWHLYGGEPSGLPIITDRWLESRWFELRATLRTTGWGTGMSEHVFVRISTTGTLQEAEATSLWPELMRALAPIGLIQRRS